MLSLPKAVNNILNTLEASGFPAYAVGGCVRDLYMGMTPHDYDICTAALPCEIKTVFAGDRLVTSGEKYGTVAVVRGGKAYEITSFRADGAYRDTRRPDAVKFGVSVEDDLLRRDFTVNAMAFSPMRGIVDICGSKADIASKTLRCVGEPKDRFSQDALRILRLARFCSQLGFKPQSNTLCAAETLAPLLENVSAERICTELSRLLTCTHVSYALVTCKNIFKPIFGEFDDEKWRKAAEYIELSPQQLSIRLALLAGAVGTDFLSALRFDKSTSKTAVIIAEHLFTPFAEDTQSVLSALNKYGENNIRLILSAQRCAGISTQAFEEKMAEVLSQDVCFSLKQLAVNGNDAVLCGYKGKETGAILSVLLKKVMSGEVKNDRTILLNLLSKYSKINVQEV